jgi:hypothetical protein
LEEPPLKEFAVELQQSIKPLVTELLTKTKHYENQLTQKLQTDR